MEPLILAIDTSCDETAAAVTCGRRVLANVISSQVDLHKKYGGVYPALAKRAHEERINFVVEEALRRASIVLHHPLKSSNFLKDVKGPLKEIKAVAVTYGPGLAIALEVGIRKAKEIVSGSKVHKGTKVQRNNHSEPLNLCTSAPFNLIAVNHLEGHLYSCLAQNATGKPEREILFPALCLLVSGGHTQLVLMKDHGVYQVLGQTLDDACGEALDKAARILKLGYPGGPIIEVLAEQHSNKATEQRNNLTMKQCNNETMRQGNNVISKYRLSTPMTNKNDLNFSYSGLKTQFLYLVEKMSEKELGQNLHQLAFTFQESAFEQLIRKTSQAIAMYQPKTLLCGGGVMANKYLRKLLRQLAKKTNLPILFPPFKGLITDNAAMIGVAAWYKWQRKEFVKDLESLDRVPRLSLE